MTFHKMIALLLTTAALAAFTGCGDETQTTESNTHAVNFRADLRTDDNGMLPFMTPGATPIRIDTSEVVGKPFYMAIFDAGFVPGVDAPLHYQWGTIDASRTVDWTTPADLPDGPYDVLFVVYRVTEVPADAVGDPMAVAAINGDLATFTISEQDIREGDPPLTAGVLRVNIEGEDAVKTTENRWADDLSDIEAGTAAFTDTILFVP